MDENGEVMKVPAFLNKLYTMVSDSEVDDLIYWGESGDSFFGTSILLTFYFLILYIYMLLSL